MLCNIMLCLLVQCLTLSPEIWFKICLGVLLFYAIRWCRCALPVSLRLWGVNGCKTHKGLFVSLHRQLVEGSFLPVEMKGSEWKRSTCHCVASLRNAVTHLARSHSLAQPRRDPWPHSRRALLRPERADCSNARGGSRPDSLPSVSSKDERRRVERVICLWGLNSPTPPRSLTPPRLSGGLSALCAPPQSWRWTSFLYLFVRRCPFEATELMMSGNI